MWKTFRNLQNGNHKNKDNKIIIHNNKPCTNDTQKANAFVSFYKSTSKLKISKVDRLAKPTANKIIRDLPATEEDLDTITQGEVLTAVKNMKANTASGPDKIHPRFIKNLGPMAIEELRYIYQTIWRKGDIPQQWRSADIRAIPKAGKDPSQLSSYRPISLTSCLGKGMEKIVCNRLRFHLEQNNKITPYQAGFRPNRGVEDQLIRLSQAISDAFQKKPMERTILCLLDYSKAYDTVWRDNLILKMARLVCLKELFNGRKVGFKTVYTG